MIPTLFSSHYINIILCFPRIRTWLPRGHSINTAWQATWLLGSSVNSLGLLGVKASVFQQLWGMICVHQPHCDLISLRRGGFFHLKVPACPRSVRSRRGRMGWCPPSGSFPGDNQTEPTEICYLAVAKSNANSTYHAESLKFCPMFTRRTHRQLTSIREKKNTWELGVAAWNLFCPFAFKCHDNYHHNSCTLKGHRQTRLKLKHIKFWLQWWGVILEPEVELPQGLVPLPCVNSQLASHIKVSAKQTKPTPANTNTSNYGSLMCF